MIKTMIVNQKILVLRKEIEVTKEILLVNLRTVINNKRNSLINKILKKI